MPNGTAIYPGPTRSETEMEGCSGFLHLRTCREKMFMVMASHGDARGTGAEVPAFAVAGLLASQYAWEEFVTKYSALIFQGMEPGELLKIAGSTGIVAFGAVAGAATSPSILSSSKSSPLPAKGIDPRLICFEHCVLAAARSIEPAAAGETVCFVMDWREPLASAALWHLEELMNFAPPGLRERLGALGFEHPGTFPPLRAARWLAHHCFDMIPSAGRGPDSQDLPGLEWTFLDESPSISSLKSPQMS